MIRFENVTYSYPFAQAPAVRDISFCVSPGELVLVSGQSGCGKSTLMRLANGLCPGYFRGTLKGRVLVEGRETTTMSPGEISHAFSGSGAAVFCPRRGGRACLCA